eukprot:2982720-Amphidinium_carterae.2
MAEQRFINLFYKTQSVMLTIKNALGVGWWASVTRHVLWPVCCKNVRCSYETFFPPSTPCCFLPGLGPRCLGVASHSSQCTCGLSLDQPPPSENMAEQRFIDC